MAMGWVDAPNEWVVGWRWAANKKQAAWGVLGNVDGNDDHRGGVKGAWEAINKVVALQARRRSMCPA